MPRPIRSVEPLFIPMPDGTRLAARAWLPDDAEANPVPAILEYIPYRWRDGTRSRDEAMHGWFAAQGYAAIRVDLPGSGDSDGLLGDEYDEQELAFACAVIDWLARQPWCDGKVGMIGKSWGGFNALQVAARRPPALKAVISVCSTDDRYADDVHFMGGALLNDNLSWGAAMLAWQALPPTPSISGSGWREAWRRRLEHLPFFPALWASRQRRDAFWKHGSVCEDWSAIAVPVFAVGGWADAYTNAVPRLLEHLAVPRLGLIGPWAHCYPHEGVPGPAIGFLQEARRWWDHWLRGIDTGIMAEPMLRAFMEEHAPPGAPGDRPGRWIGEASWPSRLITRRPMFLSPGQLWWRPALSADLAVRSPLWSGLTAGEWMASGLPGEAPADQRLDDGLSLVFDSKELADRIEILGAPELVLELASDAPTGQICVRLGDVAPDGSATRVSWQILNLTHRDGHETPRPLEPGAFEIVRIRLCDCAHAFPAGHRIRLSISTAAWPTAWPAQDAATLTVRTGDSALILPVRRPRREDAAIRFEPPQSAPTGPATALAAPRIERRFSLDLVTGEATMVVDGDAFGAAPTRFEAIDTDFAHESRRDFSIRDGDPASARQSVAQSCSLACEGRRFRTEVTAEMTATREAFRIAGTVRAFEDDDLLAERRWDEAIPRDGV
ncbi:CocE/NonD family hydrolase [Labrys wisconsinensis]|uniref:CocE/NonD family hydrolase n=1 Tax=Labrys wisconsinensis TaxID=425677 RepID=A0ABU0JAH3_9HYPH|nr:CocE/NonD family hydrolase [Labrys wisconsinensis]MDQ0471258.1 putative CocE/NonD family hydrolase [Labrys wisconsinensis]